MNHGKVSKSVSLFQLFGELMRKILFSILLSISAIAPVSPCEQSGNIKKAIVIIESVLRHAETSYVCPFEAEHALQVYFKEFRGACAECQELAYFQYNQLILKLERLLEECRR